MSASPTWWSRSIAIASAGADASWCGYRDAHAAWSTKRSLSAPTDDSQESNDTTSGCSATTSSGSRVTGRSGGMNTLGIDSHKYVSAFSSASGSQDAPE